MTVAPAAGAGRAPGARRVLIGVLLAAVGIGAVFNGVAFTLLCTAIAVGSLWEVAQLAARKGTVMEFPVALVAVLAYLGLTHFRLIHRYEGVLLGTTVIVALATATLSSRGSVFARVGITLFGVLYIGKLITYFIAIRSLPHVAVPATVAVISLIVVTDVFAMLVGVRFGRTPLTPISPRKTVEGAVGGLVAATSAGAVMALSPWFHLPVWQGVFTGAITSLAAQAGDIVESALKRDAKVKDAGSLIAGHGGVLDRFDSFLFGGIAFYFALWLIGVIPRGLFSD